MNGKSKEKWQQEKIKAERYGKKDEGDPRNWRINVNGRVGKSGSNGDVKKMDDEELMGSTHEKILKLEEKTKESKDDEEKEWREYNEESSV